MNLEGWPKDPEENLEFRINLRQKAQYDKGLQQACIEESERSILFYAHFVYVYNPHYENKVWPLCPFDYQDEALLAIDGCIEKQEQLCIVKSRDTGASWMCCIAMQRRWLFKKRERFLMMSRKSELVDDPADPDSLFWKIDFINQHLPRWMLREQDFKRKKMSFEHVVNGSTISGETTTSASGVGGRYTAVFLDEFSRMENADEILLGTADTGNCRIFNGTIWGNNNAFYQMAHDNHTRQLRMGWYEHPHKNKGLYKYDDKARKVRYYKWDAGDHQLVEVDRAFYKWPADYEHVCDGWLRSPVFDKRWFDNGCNRRDMAMNWNMDWLGSQYQYFDSKTIEEYCVEHVREPYNEVDLEFDDHTGMPKYFVVGKGAPIKLWCLLDEQGRVPKDEYCAAADISFGTGASNSVFVLARVKTGEKILEWATPRLRPEQFAVKCLALVRMFCDDHGEGAKFIWEMQGPGVTFGNTIVNLGYRNIYYRTNEHSLERKQSDTPGWMPTPDNKRDVLEKYRGALSRREYLNRSEDALRECLSYIHTTKGDIVHSKTQNVEDPTGALASHGDRVIADALCFKLCKSHAYMEVKKQEVPYASMAWRRERRQKKEVAELWA